MNPNELENCEVRIREARQRLFATLGEVQERLRPSALAQDAIESATAGVATMARNGARAVRKRPAATAAVAGAIGLVMARGWILDIFRSRKPRDETPKVPDSLKAKPARKRTKKGSD